jgi:glycosyltransferase involved in cell wall biosynthesis
MARVVLINQFFWPDLAATGQLLTDLARHLADLGHDVTVICGSGTYAGTEATPRPPVEIVRVPGLRFVRSTATRLLSYLSFYVGALWRALCAPKADVIVTLTTPPLLGLIGRVVQVFRRSRHYIWEMDMYPDVAIDLGVLTARSAATRAIRWLADYARRHSDGVIVLGECMRQRLIDRGLPDAKISVAENWADGALIHPVAPRMRNAAMTVIYPGNLGLAHDVATLACAMRELGFDRRYRFVFVGGGPRVADLKRFCESNGVANAHFLSYCGRDRLNDLMSEADVGLVTQSEVCLGSLVPSKVYSLMAAGLPILFIGPRPATPSLVIRRFDCGWQVDCGDSESLLAVLRTLQADRAQACAAGARARTAFLAHYDSPVAVRRIVSVLGLKQTLAVEPKQFTAVSK